MAESVRAIANIVDTNTGQVLVPKGAIGTATGYTITGSGAGSIPLQREMVFTTQFIVNDNPILVATRLNKDIEFVDGIIGVLRMLFVNSTIMEIEMREGINQSFPELFPASIKIKFTNGLALIILCDRVTGSLKFDFEALF